MDFSNSELDITILCKVVDNFGDIGFVLRLARELTRHSELDSESLNNIKLRIVTDNLKSFSLLEPKINPNVSEQTVNGVKIFDWNKSDVCLSEFRKNPPKIILECFECGRPKWLENLLFTEKVPNIVHIIMIDYLTAEPYAETFHKLQSLTRSAHVQKVNFMPGFTSKTGGLIFSKDELGNSAVVEALETTSLRATAYRRLPKASNLRKETNVIANRRRSNLFNILMFGYPRNYSPVLRALQNFAQQLKKSGKTTNILLAQGAGLASFKDAVVETLKTTSLRAKRSNLLHLQTLPFLSQTEWDKLLYSCDLLFVRGEDSLSRACLSGIPFVWHAYPQTEEYQLVKVNALLERMKAHFSEKDFAILQKCWQVYNTTNASESEVENALIAFFLQYNSLCAGFKSFAASLFKNGNFAEHLVEFIFEKLNSTNKI